MRFRNLDVDTLYSMINSSKGKYLEWSLGEPYVPSVPNTVLLGSRDNDWNVVEDTVLQDDVYHLSYLGKQPVIEHSSEIQSDGLDLVFVKSSVVNEVGVITTKGVSLIASGVYDDPFEGLVLVSLFSVPSKLSNPSPVLSTVSV